jgi:hypothetical protein
MAVPTQAGLLQTAGRHGAGIHQALCPLPVPSSERQAVLRVRFGDFQRRSIGGRAHRGRNLREHLAARNGAPNGNGDGVDQPAVNRRCDLALASRANLNLARNLEARPLCPLSYGLGCEIERPLLFLEECNCLFL